MITVVEREILERNLLQIEFGRGETHQGLRQQAVDGGREETADEVADRVVARLISSALSLFAVVTRPPSPS